MTTTRARSGEPLHFPSPFIVDDDGHLVPPSDHDLAAFAAEIAPKGLPLFVRGLGMGARRRRYQPRWSAMNRARLQLARLCIDRMLAEGLDVPAEPGP